MFTGIIATVGTVVSRHPLKGDLRLGIRAKDFANEEIQLGDSIACDGVCLTVVKKQEDDYFFDVSNESLDHSLIGHWQDGGAVNLELALQPQSRLGGHLVSGHVDGLAKLTSLEEQSRSWRMRFSAPPDLQKYITPKGSVTLNGVSLTVNGVQGGRFDVNIIPHTFEVTNLGQLMVGDQVHLEVDLIARYLERLLAGDTSATSGLSYSFLSDHGFT